MELQRGCCEVKDDSPNCPTDNSPVHSHNTYDIYYCYCNSHDDCNDSECNPRASTTTSSQRPSTMAPSTATPGHKSKHMKGNLLFNITFNIDFENWYYFIKFITSKTRFYKLPAARLNFFQKESKVLINFKKNLKISRMSKLFEKLEKH